MEIDPKITTAIKREFITALKDEGLVLIPHEAGPFVVTFFKKQQSLLKRKCVTPYQIANYKLIPGINNITTIKNWIDNGKITADEWFMRDGKYYVLTSAVKRLNEI